MFPSQAPLIKEGLNPGLQSPSLMPALLHHGAIDSSTSFTGPHPLQGAGLGPAWVLLYQEGLALAPAASTLSSSTPTGSLLSSLGGPLIFGWPLQISAPHQCKGGASCLRTSSDSTSAVSSLCWPQILEDSSRGLQGVGGSRSTRSSCSSAWLRRYISM